MMNLMKNKPWSKVEYSHGIMFLLILILGVFSFIFGEKTPASNGFGWDGVIYGNLVRNIDVLISSDQLNNYYAHRSLPAFIVRTIMLTLNIPMSDFNIIQTFEVFNLICLFLACFVWKKIADKLELNLTGRWIGFCGFFLNFSYSKMIFYLPVLTDAAAFLIALSLLYFYLNKRALPILVLTLLGAFCWPGVSTVGAVLLFFLNFNFSSQVISPDTSQQIIKNTEHKKIFIYGLVVLVSALIGRYIASEFDLAILGVFLTGIPTIYFLIIGLIVLISSFNFIKELWRLRKNISLMVMAYTLLALAIPSYIGYLMANPALHNPNNFLELSKLLLLPPDGKVFLPFVTLIVFWGPMLLLAIMYWQAVATQLRGLGPGAVGVVALILPLGLATEPRFILMAWPFLLISLVLAMQKIEVKPQFKPVMIALVILFSKFWLIINWGEWHEGLYVGLQQLPKQLLFMHLGIWMNWTAYLIQLVLIIVFAAILRKLIIRFKN